MVYTSLTNFTYTKLIVYIRNSCNLFGTVKFAGIYPTVEFGTLKGVGTLKGIDKHIRLLI